MRDFGLIRVGMNKFRGGTRYQAQLSGPVSEHGCAHPLRWLACRSSGTTFSTSSWLTCSRSWWAGKASAKTAQPVFAPFRSWEWPAAAFYCCSEHNRTATISPVCCRGDYGYRLYRRRRDSARRGHGARHGYRGQCLECRRDRGGGGDESLRNGRCARRPEPDHPPRPAAPQTTARSVAGLLRLV